VKSLLALLAAALLLAACGGDSSTTTPVVTAPTTPSPTTTAAPLFPTVPVTTPPAEPVRLPADDAAHSYFTEWWYYTGHLDAGGAARAYGFEFVIFQVRPFPGQPPVYISHFALTDPDPAKPFRYDSRLSFAPQAPASEGVTLEVGGWTLRAFDGRDEILAAMEGASIDLRLTAEKPAAVHGGDGLLPFAGAGWTYYYSRTRLAVEGTLTIEGSPRSVTGIAWFDHQWGDFNPTFGDGGWDWLSAQLEDGTDIMAVVLRDQAGAEVGGFGTIVDREGQATDLETADFAVEATGTWISPATGITYPSGWTLSIPGEDLSIDFTPVRPDQELDVRDSTGNIYWEGAVSLEGSRAGTPVKGSGYVELTGYDRRD
jgi:predicted secreted hydrolase